MKKYFFIFFAQIFISYSVFSESIVSAFGIYYKTPYEKGIEQIKKDGFTITKIEDYKDSDCDRKYVKVSAFDYDGLPFSSGTFTFERDIDGKYYLFLSEGYVDTNKIDNNPKYADGFGLYLTKLKNRYEMNVSEDYDKTFVLFEGTNGGCILLVIMQDGLFISYQPKAKSW